MSEDLRGAAKSLTNRDRLILVSSQLPRTLQTLEEHLVPSCASLQQLLGGTLASLHARTARHILEYATDGLSAGQLRPRYRELAERHARVPKTKRVSASDDRVRHFIEAQLTKEPTASRTGMLQQFRQTSWACEHGRFARLFSEVRETLRAPTS